MVCDCIFEKWIRLNGTAAVIETQLTNSRSDHTSYGEFEQELPAIYTVGSLYRLVAYNGTEPFMGGPLTKFPLSPPTNILATEHWAALVNNEDWGLGVFQPGTIFINGAFFGTPGAYGPHDNPTGYLGPRHMEILDWNIEYRFTFHLVLGDINQIRTYADQHQHKIENCLDSQFVSDRQHWVYKNAADTGVPQGYWSVIMEKDDPQLYGPNCFWKAEEHPILYINASFGKTQASTDAQVFFSPAGLGTHFTETDSVRFPIKADGMFHLIEVDLSQSPSYEGTMFQLRFDPVVTGTKGAYVKITSIILK